MLSHNIYIYFFVLPIQVYVRYKDELSMKTDDNDDNENYLGWINYAELW